MRIPLLLIVLFFASPLARADDARGVIDAAIKAHSATAGALDKTRTVTFTSKGTIQMVGSGVASTRTATLAAADKARWAVDMGQGDQKMSAILTINGLKGWRSMQGAPQVNMTPAECDTVAEETHVYWLATIAPLANTSLSLASKPDTAIDGKAQRVVVVSVKGKPDVKLFFDKNSNLLTKATFEGNEAGLKIPKEFLFSDHKAFGGVKLPAKIVENKGGKVAAEWTVESYTFPELLDPMTFTRP